MKHLTSLGVLNPSPTLVVYRFTAPFFTPGRRLRFWNTVGCFWKARSDYGMAIEIELRQVILINIRVNTALLFLEARAWPKFHKQYIIRSICRYFAAISGVINKDAVFDDTLSKVKIFPFFKISEAIHNILPKIVCFTLAFANANLVIKFDN